MNEVKMTMETLIKHANKRLENDEPLTVMVEMPGFELPESITTPPENIKKKIEYYKATYDENCNHKHAKGIRIIAVAH